MATDSVLRQELATVTADINDLEEELRCLEEEMDFAEKDLQKQVDKLHTLEDLQEKLKLSRLEG